MLLKKRFFSALLGFFIAGSVHAETVLQGLHGEKTPFSSLSGKWVLINYWASWCRPCLAEIPVLNRFYEKHKAGNVALFAVNYDTPSLKEQESLIKQFNIHYPALLKDPSNALHLGSIHGVPVTFVFNPQGKLVKKLYGSQTMASLDEVLTN